VRSSEALIPDVYLSKSSRIEGSAVVEPPLVPVEHRHMRHLEYAVSTQIEAKPGIQCSAPLTDSISGEMEVAWVMATLLPFGLADDVDFG